jgi:hypothetical protein
MVKFFSCVQGLLSNARGKNASAKGARLVNQVESLVSEDRMCVCASLKCMIFAQHLFKMQHRCNYST